MLLAFSYSSCSWMRCGLDHFLPGTPWEKIPLGDVVGGMVLSNCHLGVGKLSKSTCLKGLRPWIDGTPVQQWPFCEIRTDLRFGERVWFGHEAIVTARYVMIDGRNAFVLGKP